MPHRFYRLAELLAQMSFNIMVCWAIFSQTLKLGYTYMTNWCGAGAVLHNQTPPTASVWATMSVCLWVTSGDRAETLCTAGCWVQACVVCAGAHSNFTALFQTGACGSPWRICSLCLETYVCVCVCVRLDVVPFSSSLVIGFNFLETYLRLKVISP